MGGRDLSHRASPNHAFAPSSTIAVSNLNGLRQAGLNFRPALPIILVIARLSYCLWLRLLKNHHLCLADPNPLQRFLDVVGRPSELFVTILEVQL